MERYTPFFDHPKLSETFKSQKDIYEIVEDITKLIKNLLKIGIIEYKELGNKYIEVSNYYTLVVNSLSSSNYMSASFNIKNLLSKISHRNGAYVDIINFYENYPHATLSLYVESKTAKEDAHYVPNTKNIVVYLTNNFDNFFMKIEKENYDTTDIMIAVSQIFSSNNFEKNLIHEMTHMYDDIISKQKAITATQSKYIHASDSVEGYMSNPVEINARFYSAVYASEYEKLQQCTSQRALKIQWERKYFDSINSIVKLQYLNKEQRAKIKKRAWVEFTTLTNREEKLLTVLSKKTIVNNADIKKIDVRIKNKVNVVKELKQDFIDLSIGKISKSVFNKKDPLDNDELNDEIKTKQEMLKKIEMQTEWETLYYFHDIYEHITKYGSDDYDTQLLDYLMKDLRLDSDIINKIKIEYGII